MAELRRRLPETILRIYYPLDLRAWVRRSLSAVRPCAVVLAEAEIWPNFLWQTADLGIPVLLVNARISTKSRDRYCKFRGIFRELFASLQLVCCPSEAEAARMREVGCRPDPLRIVGNLKYDLAVAPSNGLPNLQSLVEQLRLPLQTPILLGGSTHPGEEALLGRVFLRLRTRFPQLFLIVVPRHFERASDAVRDLQALGLRVVRRSRLHTQTTAGPPGVEASFADALVVDSTGELPAFYTLADVVVIGKSFLARGGQNPIEPAAAARPVVTGPHMENFSWVMEDFLRHKAILQVPDEAALHQTLSRLMGDPQLRLSLGQRAQATVQAGTGAVRRTIDHLLQTIGHLFD
jgi:3-deoxy-D-manno-octulosonic-acid transferase